MEKLRNIGKLLTNKHPNNKEGVVIRTATESPSIAQVKDPNGSDNNYSDVSDSIFGDGVPVELLNFIIPGSISPDNNDRPSQKSKNTNVNDDGYSIFDSGVPVGFLNSKMFQ